MMKEIVKLIAQQLRPLSTRVANMAARGVVKLVDDAKKMQLLQVALLDGETRDKIERFQNYGFSSVPEDDAEALALFLGGRREHGVVIAVDDRRYRLKDLAKGEVAVYHKSGSKIVMKANGNIEITSDADVIVNGGSTPVAKEGSATTGHQHNGTGMTAGPYPVSGMTMNATDTVATGAGSGTVKVP